MRDYQGNSLAAIGEENLWLKLETPLSLETLFVADHCKLRLFSENKNWSTVVYELISELKYVLKEGGLQSKSNVERSKIRIGSSGTVCHLATKKMQLNVTVFGVWLLLKQVRWNQLRGVVECSPRTHKLTKKSDLYVLKVINNLVEY